MITFPRTMPTVGAIGITFEPDRADYLSREAGGRLGAVTAGFPGWAMKISLNAMKSDDAAVWRAWLAVQRGAQRQFVAFDIDRRRPRRHQDGRPYNPSPSSWSQAVDDDDLAALTLTGLLAGQTVSIGDYVGFVWDGNKRGLVRAVETKIAGGDGRLSVAVEPPLPIAVPPSATVTLRDVGCLMRLVSAETKLAEQGLGFMASGGTISAVEDFVA